MPLARGEGRELRSPPMGVSLDTLIGEPLRREWVLMPRKRLERSQ